MKCSYCTLALVLTILLLYIGCRQHESVKYDSTERKFHSSFLELESLSPCNLIDQAEIYTSWGNADVVIYKNEFIWKQEIVDYNLQSDFSTNLDNDSTYFSLKRTYFYESITDSSSLEFLGATYCNLLEARKAIGAHAYEKCYWPDFNCRGGIVLTSSAGSDTLYFSKTASVIHGDLSFDSPVLFHWVNERLGDNYEYGNFRY